MSIAASRLHLTDMFTIAPDPGDYRSVNCSDTVQCALCPVLVVLVVLDCALRCGDWDGVGPGDLAAACVYGCNPCINGCMLAQIQAEITKLLLTSLLQESFTV